MPTEKAGERAGLDGVHPVGEVAEEGEAGVLRIAEHVEFGVGELGPQRGEGGQGEHEVTQGPATDDQDSPHGVYVEDAVDR